MYLDCAADITYFNTEGIVKAAGDPQTVSVILELLIVSFIQSRQK